jgi:ribosomal protein S21
MAHWRDSTPVLRSRRPMHVYVDVTAFPFLDLALRKFKRLVGDVGLAGEMKRREFAMSPGQKRKRKERAARHRRKKAILKQARTEAARDWRMFKEVSAA